MASSEYVFIDEWDVDAAQEEVFEALADARTYPQWWTPTYIEVDADGPPAVGRSSCHKFKAKLPYTLKTTSTIARLEPPNEVEAHVDGDLRGRGIWTLTLNQEGKEARQYMKEIVMAKTSRGRAQDRARVAGGQDYEVRYEEQQTGKAGCQESWQFA